MVYGFHTIKYILQLAGKKSRPVLKNPPYTMYKPKPKVHSVWRGKAKDYPGAKEVVNMNKQGITGKKKPKLTIV